MTKYNLSEIMKRAWVIYRTTDITSFSKALKESWVEAKAPVVKDVEYYTNLVNAIKDKWVRENTSNTTIYASVKYWEKYGKSRRYFTIVEVRNSNRSRKEYTFGYYDNKSGEYVTTKYDRDLDNIMLSDLVA